MQGPEDAAHGPDLLVSLEFQAHNIDLVGCDMLPQDARRKRESYYRLNVYGLIR